MAFWSDGSISPKLSFQWLLTLGSSETPIANYTLRSFQKPSFQLAVSEYLNINDLAYKPGVLQWNPIEINLVDAEGTFENNTAILYDIMRKSGYVRDMQTGRSPATAIVKKQNAALIGSGDSDYGGQIIFDQIDSHGLAYEQWILWNPFISSINFGQASYATDEIMTINAKIYYDFAEYRKLG
tara:strand:- start:713 stop:1261 length:549 start_codon:yes stop_codon:yes gene_type:complete